MSKGEKKEISEQISGTSPHPVVNGADPHPPCLMAPAVSSWTCIPYRSQPATMRQQGDHGHTSGALAAGA